jgi:hypothetical protein
MPKRVRAAAPSAYRRCAIGVAGCASFLVLSFATHAVNLHVETVNYFKNGGNRTIEWYYNPEGQSSRFFQSEVVDVFRRAMSKWEAACGIRFIYRGVTRDSPMDRDGVNVVGWEEQIHSPGLASGRIGGNAAGHARYGAYRGKFEMDIALSKAQAFWSLGFSGDNKVIQLRYLEIIAVHEIGHVLGFMHSDDDPESVMHAGKYTDDFLAPKASDKAACKDGFSGVSIQ